MSSMHSGEMIQQPSSSSMGRLPPQQGQQQEGDGSVPSSLFFQPLTARGNRPPARWAHCAVAVNNNTQMVVFGGIGTTMLGDLWILDMDSSAWRAVQPTVAANSEAPEKIMAAAAAAVGSRVWVFGGQKGRQHTRKLHIFDVQRHTWQQPPCRGSLPSARAGHAMATVGSTIYMFGGLGKKLMNDLHRLDTDLDFGTFNEIRVAGQPPLARQGMAFVYDGADSLVCFGGTSSNGIDNSLSVFSVSRNEWRHPQQHGRAPSPRTNHAAVLLSPHVILVCGGCNSAGTFFSDCHILDTRTFTWHQPQSLNPGFAPRYNHSVCLGPNGRVFLYGGINSKQTFDSVVTMDTKDTIGDDLSAVAAELESIARSSATSTARESCESSFSNQREMDLMRIQLTDLLYKRNMEEHLHQASSRAEATEQQLAWVKDQLERARAENLQLGLLCVEAEEGRRSEQALVREAEAKATKSAQALAEAQAAHEATRAQLARVQAEADAVQQLREDHVRELGVLSSRYARLQQQYSSVCRQLGGSSSERPPAGAHLSSRSLAENADAAGASGFLHGDCTSPGLLQCISSPASANGAVVLAPLSRESFTRLSDCDGEQADETLHVLLADAQAEACRLREQLETAVSERDRLRDEVEQLHGRQPALTKLPVSRLQELERTLEQALRATRDTVLMRRIAEVEQRAVTEQQCCSLCLERPRNLVFNCGHQSCSQCGEQLPLCPFCRKEITMKVKLFAS